MGKLVFYEHNRYRKSEFRNFSWFWCLASYTDSDNYTKDNHLNEISHF